MDQLAEVHGSLPFLDGLTRLDYLRLQCFALVLPQLLNKGIFHLVEEAAIELVPLGGLQITLFQLGGLPEYVDFPPNKQVPALKHVIILRFTVMMEFLCFSQA